MVYGVYAMRDKHVGFLEPRLDVNDKAAIRNFASTMNNAPRESIIAFAPSDFDLYRLGEFDTDKGMFTTMIPEFLISGSSCVGGSNYEAEA